jgi:hypothetical protein
LKKKEIMMLVGGLITIVVCGYIMYTLLYPNTTSPPQAKTNQTQDNFKYVKVEMNQNVYAEILKLNDYGTPELTGIGKPNLFSNY